VASVEASQRFEVNATQLSLLAVLQLVVYAAMQIPVGILLDKFGPKRVLAAGALIMAAGQATLAVSQTFELAVAGRMLVGLGDAFTFISMIRMVNVFLSGPKASRLQQWLATLGQLGQIASAFPFLWLLDASGWTPAFLSVASLSLFGGCLVIIFGGVDAGNQRSDISFRTVISGLKQNISRAPIRMAFWTHFTTQSSGTMFVLLWGMPFLTLGQGYSRTIASSLLALFVLTNATMGPVLGAIAAKGFAVRARLVVGAPLLGMFMWIATLAWPSQAPLWLIALMVVSIGMGGPASMLAFDYSRAYTSKNQLGSVNGFVNIGGFLASFTMMAIIGVMLDLLNHAQPEVNLYNIENFKIALPAHFVITALGLVFFLRELRRTLAVEGIKE
jgi:MFS family permease